MKWISIGGSWRKTNKQVEEDVRRSVREVISNGDGIVSGGALGVDYMATDEALKLNPSADRIKIFLPSTLDIYVKHYRKRAEEGVITSKQAEELIAQLSRIAKINKNALIENRENKIVDKDNYYKRNSEIVDYADELISFHVNESAGTLDAINKAKKRGIPVKEFDYIID